MPESSGARAAQAPNASSESHAVNTNDQGLDVGVEVIPEESMEDVDEEMGMLLNFVQQQQQQQHLKQSPQQQHQQGSEAWSQE
eukprot:15448863-Alexandrium_andersonii.AAC.1